MPPRKSAPKGSRGKRIATRASTRRQNDEDHDVPAVFRDMLVEAYQDNPEHFFDSPQPSKRRKITHDEDQVDALTQLNNTAADSHLHSAEGEQEDLLRQFPDSANLQLAYNDDLDDSDSDAEFEDVDIAADAIEQVSAEDSVNVEIDLSAPRLTPKRALQRRKPVTKAERDFRLAVHKCHLVFLLTHVAVRNHWCNDEALQKSLKPLIPRKWVSRLHREGTQVEQKTSFDSAIEEICRIWKAKWTVTARGLKRAYWREQLDLQKELEDSEDLDFDDFCDTAKTFSGSRDVGAQLLCALLRSLAVETRLVCSLQVLPFSRVAKGETPQKTDPSYLFAGDQDFGTTRATKKVKEVEDSAYPIWWVEIYSTTIEQWVPLDPIVRNTINKPRTSFEPPGSDSLNSMSYVIALDDNGRAKDVTIRYTSAYNAKTRRTRVESTKNGAEWFRGVINFFAKNREPRDQVEEAALHRRLAQEGMPKNVQDFKDHPVYVLERHLRANEVIEPRREIGKFSSGKNSKIESVYRRQDVHICRSVDSWYRKGRDIKVGEQPLKRVPKRRGPSAEPNDADGEDEGVSLYAEFQTQLYVPPPVVNGRVPRNGYGNLDIYVSSMIPAGGVHVRHPLAERAAKILGIDAIAAVVGFKFKGRQGTAIIDGVIVDEHFTASIIETTTALEDELDQDLQAERSAILSSVWKKMHTVLSMRQRLQDEYGGLDDGTADDSEDSSYQEDLEGGFFAGDVDAVPTATSTADENAAMTKLKDRQPIVLPEPLNRQRVVITRSPHKPRLVQQNSVDSLFAYDSGEDTLVNEHGKQTEVSRDLPDAVHEYAASAMPQNDVNGGGFTVEEDYGGGFIVEEHQSISGKNDQDAISTNRAEPDEGDGGGFLRDDEDDEAAAGYEVNAALDSSLDVAGDPQATANNSIVQEPPGANVAKQKGQTAVSDHASETDMSDLSHDPEEDEADMQWVDDAFED